MQQAQKQRDRPPIVLIIDDNPAIRNVVAWSLQFGGFQPVEASNGLEAVKWMEQASTEQHYPSVILLDLAMPGMNGHAFLDWLHSSWVGHHPLPAIIIITAGQMSPAVTPPSMVKQIVTKPFHVRDLLEVIRRWTP